MWLRFPCVTDLERVCSSFVCPALVNGLACITACGVFMGVLEVLLGKPGTLHFPGLNAVIAGGVPPDLTEGFSVNRCSRTVE